MDDEFRASGGSKAPTQSINRARVRGVVAWVVLGPRAFILSFRKVEGTRVGLCDAAMKREALALRDFLKDGVVVLPR